ncbi:hypothetical protein ANCDUO_05796 [Ancylostoma duodenale]|uniref:Uncharacterized protein n=1 Tax=Ancylostoma duodenale TaxID=51022 RepID=A0A0C2GRI8_9BILA|nr:hypothetical protein ANCDUO_05796 [Ancylostoma duodenale]
MEKTISDEAGNAKVTRHQVDEAHPNHGIGRAGTEIIVRGAHLRIQKCRITEIVTNISRSMIEGDHDHIPPTARPTDGIGTTTVMNLGRGLRHPVIGKNERNTEVVVQGVRRETALVPPAAVAGPVRRTEILVTEIREFPNVCSHMNIPV